LNETEQSRAAVTSRVELSRAAMGLQLARS